MNLSGLLRILSLLVLALAVHVEVCAASTAPHDFNLVLRTWELHSSRKGVTIYTRIPPGSSFREALSFGELPAPPCLVLQAIRDNPRLHEFLPYIRFSHLTHTAGPTEFYCQYLGLPWPLKPRIYHVQGTRSQLSSGSDAPCRLLFQWKLNHGEHRCDYSALQAAHSGLSLTPVEPVENYGYWYLESIRDGTATRAAYHIFTDPGGSLPATFQNWFVDEAVVGVFEGFRKHLGTSHPYQQCDCNHDIPPEPTAP